LNETLPTIPNHSILQALTIGAFNLGEQRQRGIAQVRLSSGGSVFSAQTEQTARVSSRPRRITQSNARIEGIADDE